ncbi:MAG: hypothetical protein AAF604_01045 [Acidobacteriota bacterium]
MTPTEFLELFPGPFNFLRRDPEEIRGLMPDIDSSLPSPHQIFLADEEATPIQGFPILLSPGMRHLSEALEAFLEAEERVQVAVFQRRSFDRKAHSQAWERYRSHLARVIENVTLSSYGRAFPATFWLYHSLDVARVLRDAPRRLLRLDLKIARRHGDSIKFRVLDRYLSFVFTETYELAGRLAERTEGNEEELFPRLLSHMRDNVLIFTEEHISRNLEELASYFHGCLRVDGRDLRNRLEALEDWHRASLDRPGPLRLVVEHLLRASPLPSNLGEPDPASRGRELLTRPGYARFLAEQPDYPARRLLDPSGVEQWESLLLKLKEFELIHTVRRFLVPVREHQGQLVFRSEGATRSLPGRRSLVLSPATRPLDFMAPWVVEPLVHRFGLIYDLTDFSEVVSVIRRSGSDLQDGSFRQIFTFQRRINRLARDFRLSLEKYLGDGAFYSSRHGSKLVHAAVMIQRAYRQAVEQGLPFDRGVRIALNFGPYRLLPIGFGDGGPERYEFFGHGVVELTRLITGKSSKEIDEIQNMLINQGYPEQTVYRFFSPLVKRDADFMERREKARRFYAYVNANGQLINEGIVATDAYIAQLEIDIQGTPLYRVEDGDRRYIAYGQPENPDFLVALRRLGNAHLKGLGKVPIFEVVDGARWQGLKLPRAETDSLQQALKQLAPAGL